MDEVAKVFKEVWPAVMAHYNQMLADVQENIVVEREIHLRVAYSNLHQENTELKAALAARPALPDAAAVYTAQILDK